MMIHELYERIKSISEIDALALAGSRGSNHSDDKSDYDLYVYTDVLIPPDVRRKAIESLCSYAEFGNTYFEDEDNLILTDGTPVDVIYRCIPNIETMVTKTLSVKYLRSGYTTCFLHNVRTSEIIFDKSGRVTKLIEKARTDYPKPLKDAIIKRNMAMLHGYLPSYDKQIKKAYDRHDFVSINHRVAAYIASYFDVIFALNEMTHPGEKKLIDICEKECAILPADFRENLMKLFEYMFRYDVSDILENIYKELEKVVDTSREERI